MIRHELLEESRRIKQIAFSTHRAGLRLKVLFKSRSGKTRTIYYYNPRDIPEVIVINGTIFYLWSVRRDMGG